MLGHLSCEPAGSTLYELDSMGEPVWTRDYPEECIGSVELSQQGGYRINGGFKEDTLINPGDYPFPRYIALLNEDGELVWRTILNSPHYKSVARARELSDGSIISIGSFSENGTGNTKGYIAKLSPDGDLLWERTHHTRLDVNNYFYDVQPTPDGGFIVCGSARDTIDNIQSFWLVKLDSMGCLTPGCDSLDGVKPQKETIQEQIQVYPNPATTRVFFKIPASMSTPGERIQLRIYNLFGQQMDFFLIAAGQNSLEVKSTDWPQGMYLFEVNRGNRVVATGKFIIIK